ncbi:hypothetical protein BH11PLA1_BH11PLA1_17380 [soil metagenome]
MPDDDSALQEPPHPESRHPHRAAYLACAIVALSLLIITATIIQTTQSRTPAPPFTPTPPRSTPTPSTTAALPSPAPTPPAAATNTSPEFRAVWVATVANIDWPSRKGLPPATLRAEMVTILDAIASIHANAVILQVRPACDAIYPTPNLPWSEFLTGAQGQPPPDSPPDYDPLREWIDAAHARGLTLHAWINPFRARHVKATGPNAPTHISALHPDWVHAYDGYLWLDPGIPAARAWVLDTTLDMVRRYDLDGVHIDDYFYPYPKPNSAFPDDPAFAAAQEAALADHTAATALEPPTTSPTPPPPLDRNTWRRANIDDFVHSLYVNLKAAKPTLQIGISPFGIWRPGSPPQVAGMDAYATLHADSRRWLREGWCDYLAPQLYWKAEAPKQPFARLLDWWIDQNDQHRALTPGLNIGRVLPAADQAESWSPADITKQIDLMRASKGARGVILFSAKAIVENRRGLADALRAAFPVPAVPPSAPAPLIHHHPR